MNSSKRIAGLVLGLVGMGAIGQAEAVVVSGTVAEIRGCTVAATSTTSQVLFRIGTQWFRVTENTAYERVVNTAFLLNKPVTVNYTAAVTAYCGISTTGYAFYDVGNYVTLAQ